MKSMLILALVVLAGGCATTEDGMPLHAAPFSGDRPIVFPKAATGTLEVKAFPKRPGSTRAGSTAAWRLYDTNGRPLGPVRRDDASLMLPTGEYVVMGKDTRGALRTAQAVVRAGAVTQLPMAQTSQSDNNALNADTLEE
jgi:hypothetical protein